MKGLSILSLSAIVLTNVILVKAMFKIDTDTPETLKDVLAIDYEVHSNNEEEKCLNEYYNSFHAISRAINHKESSLHRSGVISIFTRDIMFAQLADQTIINRGRETSEIYCVA